MINKITIDYMDKIEALANAATPGPWTVDENKLARCVIGGVIYLQAKVLGKPMYLKNDLIFMGAAREAVPELIAEVQRLKTELAQARAAAVQWVTYDGTPETLPPPNILVLYCQKIYRDNVYPEIRTSGKWIAPDNDFFAEGHDAVIGDRWAYLPVPPEVKE